MTIGSTTITPLRTSSAYTVDEDGELEDRDEADGADEDDNIYTSSEVSRLVEDFQTICENLSFRWLYL